MTPSTSSNTDLADLGRVHFLGLAGVGVSAVARLMQSAGVPISGTDAKELPVLDEFRSAGAPVRVGYSAENLVSVEEQAGGPLSTVIASSIAKDGNPEYDEAKKRGLRILHRSEGLAAVMAGLRSIAVAGTHGKTTTSSMTTILLEKSGLEPSFAVGAAVAGLGVNAAAGEGEWFVAEADESDGSLLNYRPEVAVVTNVEADHLDHHGTAEAVDQVFADFTDRILDGGHLIICLDDPGARRLLDKVQGSLASRGVSITTYGVSEQADLRLIDQVNAGQTAETGAKGEAEDPGRELPQGSSRQDGAVLPHEFGQQFEVDDRRNGSGQAASVLLRVPGKHNALNALAAIAAGRYAGLSLEQCAQALSHFQGASRRFDYKGTSAGVRVYDDYAHHPTEVSAVLDAARSAAGRGKVHVVFQPHLFSRTSQFSDEFAQALSAADTVALLDIYPAREEPLAGVTSELIAGPLYSGEAAAGSAPQGGICSRKDAVAAVVGAASPGDIILTLGAGDVTALGAEIVEHLDQ